MKYIMCILRNRLKYCSKQYNERIIIVNWHVQYYLLSHNRHRLRNWIFCVEQSGICVNVNLGGLILRWSSTNNVIRLMKTISRSLSLGLFLYTYTVTLQDIQLKWWVYTILHVSILTLRHNTFSIKNVFWYEWYFRL